MKSLIDELLDTYDSIDKDTIASQIDKNTILTTLGFGKMGDKNPISFEDIKSWRKLRDNYLETLRKGHLQFAESLRVLLFGATSNLISRCFTSENAEALFDKLSLRWKK